MAFACFFHLQVANELEGHSVAKVDRVIGIAIGIGVFVYTFVALAGYATYGSAVGSDILTTYPENTVVSFARSAALDLASTH